MKPQTKDTRRWNSKTCLTKYLKTGECHRIKRLFEASEEIYTQEKTVISYVSVTIKKIEALFAH